MRRTAVLAGVFAAVLALSGCGAVKGEGYGSLERYEREKNRKDVEYEKVAAEAEKARENTIEEVLSSESTYQASNGYTILSADVYMGYADDVFTEIVTLRIDGKTMVVRVDWLNGKKVKVTRWFL